MDTYEPLIDIGIKLSSERDLERLLPLVLKSARDICNADAGSLYLKEKDHLRFEVMQNSTLEKKMGKTKFQGLLSHQIISISDKSIAGWSAKNRSILHIGDVYNIKNVPYSFERGFDRKTGYKCQSMLTVPMEDREGSIIGVFQLINKKEESGIVPFTDKDEKIAKALASQAGIAIRNVRLTNNLKSAHLETIYKLGLAAEYKDKETGNHVKRVAEITKIIAETLGMDVDSVERIYYASPLHDVGKIGVPDDILMKPGKLTEGEWEIMKNHTILGYQLLKDSKSYIIQLAAEIAYTHHERWDGKGYPQGLSEEGIPLSGRIVGLADFFDAVTSSRPYRKKPFSLPKTLSIIGEEFNKHFCPLVMDAFFDSIEKIKEIHKVLSDD